MEKTTMDFILMKQAGQVNLNTHILIKNQLVIGVVKHMN